MPSADQVPVITAHSKMRWPKWVVLIATAEASRKKPGPADASAGGGQLLARPHQRHAPGKPTSRCRDRSLQSSALVAPPNRGSLKGCPLLWHSRAGEEPSTASKADSHKTWGSAGSYISCGSPIGRLPRNCTGLDQRSVRDQPARRIHLRWARLEVCRLVP